MDGKGARGCQVLEVVHNLGEPQIEFFSMPQVSLPRKI